MSRSGYPAVRRQCLRVLLLSLFPFVDTPSQHKRIRSVSVLRLHIQQRCRSMRGRGFLDYPGWLRLLKASKEVIFSSFPS